MSWTCRLSREAARQLRRLPRDRRKQIAQAIEKMQTDPFQGDVRPIKSGRFRGALRRRTGPYRIIFSLDTSQSLVEIAAILPRGETTYR